MAAAPIIASAILGGPTAAAIVAVVGTLELRELRGGVPWYGFIYNHSFLVFPAVLAGATYLVATAGVGVSASHALTTPEGLAAAMAAGVVYFLVVTSMSSLAVATREGRRLSAVLRVTSRPLA